jgi:hypothetical protein
VIVTSGALQPGHSELDMIVIPLIIRRTSFGAHGGGMRGYGEKSHDECPKRAHSVELGQEDQHGRGVESHMDPDGRPQPARAVHGIGRDRTNKEEPGEL